MECMNGLMADVIRVNGKITTCMAEVYTPGKMVVCMMVSIKTIGNMVLAHIHGLMGDNILDIGKMANNTEKAGISNKME